MTTHAQEVGQTYMWQLGHRSVYRSNINIYMSVADASWVIWDDVTHMSVADASWVIWG